MSSGAWMAAALLAAAPATGPAKDEVLVIGVRAAQGLSTYLVDANGIHKAGDGIAVPRAQGWWKLSRLKRSKGKVSEDVVWTSPATKPRSPPRLEAAEGCEQSLTDELLFVGNDVFSVEESGGGYCAGAAHPWSNQMISTRKMEDPTATVEIGAALGAAATQAIEQAMAKQHGGPEKRQNDCLGDPAVSQWALIRSEGRWVARGGLGYAYEACRGNHEYFTLALSPPPQLTGVAPPTKPWPSYTQAHPGITDVVVSPSGAFELYVLPKGLEVFAGGKRVARQDLDKPALVMTQLALGKSADRWRSDVPKALGK